MSQSLLNVVKHGIFGLKIGFLVNLDVAFNLGRLILAMHKPIKLRKIINNSHMGQILNIKLKILDFAKFVWYAICHIHNMANIEIFQDMHSCSMVGVSQENCVFDYLIWVVLNIILAIMIRKWQCYKFLGRNQVPALKSSNM